MNDCCAFSIVGNVWLKICSSSSSLYCCKSICSYSCFTLIARVCLLFKSAANS